MLVPVTREIHSRILNYIVFNKPKIYRKTQDKEEFGPKYESIEISVSNEDSHELSRILSDCRLPLNLTTKNIRISKSYENEAFLGGISNFIQKGDKLILESTGCITLRFSSDPERLHLSESIDKNLITIYPENSWYDNLHMNLETLATLAILVFISVASSIIG
ncbi:hypothetical protein [Thalassotalea agarivorans]|uniref:Uncharacterized protein n=1 Tax=Thalassotalea agarivorans TaxID=349064 RepID=A0A1H9ZAF8_THASX|nr:hypothetical protein [Thalassotalea agarivorans]SES78508.1 hypothetical protein SAMN05660429_00380 [Thalassotalea agarivorans]